MMWIFPALLFFLGFLFVWQLVGYMRERGMHHRRKISLLRMMALLILVGFLVFGWNKALVKFTQFELFLPPYPGATADIFDTPILSDAPAWSYEVKASPDKIFNWYRARSKHAGWIVAEETGFGDRAFVIVTTPRLVTLVILREAKGKTEILYTQEIDMHRVK